MNALTVTASRWSAGWELEIDDNHHTAVRDLGNARRQVVDYLDSLNEKVDHSTWEITIIPDLGELSDEVAAARNATKAAASATETAAKQSHDVARKLRSAGYSVADSAAILGISKGRVSQLVNT